MEPAIAENLRVERTLPPRVVGQFHPPYPSHVARFKPCVMRLAMAYSGVRIPATPPRPPAPTHGSPRRLQNLTAPVTGTGRIRR